MHLLILLSSDQFLFKEVANVSKAMIIDLDAHQVMIEAMQCIMSCLKQKDNYYDEMNYKI